jgi:hypothetical protein
VIHRAPPRIHRVVTLVSIYTVMAF